MLSQDPLLRFYQTLLRDFNKSPENMFDHVGCEHYWRLYTQDDRAHHAVCRHCCHGNTTTIDFDSMFPAIRIPHACHLFVGFPSSALRLHRGAILSFHNLRHWCEVKNWWKSSGRTRQTNQTTQRLEHWSWITMCFLRHQHLTWANAKSALKWSGLGPCSTKHLWTCECFWIWKTNGGSPHNERKTGEDESKDCFCVRHDSSTRCWTRHLCARSTTKTNKMLVSQDHEKRKKNTARNGNGDRTTPQDFVPVGSGWSLPDKTSRESVGRSVLQFQWWKWASWTRWVSGDITDARSPFLDVSVCTGITPVHSTQNLTQPFDGHGTDTDEQIKEHTLLRSLPLNQPNKRCTEPGSLASTFGIYTENRGAIFPTPNKDLHQEPCPNTPSESAWQDPATQNSEGFLP